MHILISTLSLSLVAVTGGGTVHRIDCLVAMVVGVGRRGGEGSCLYTAIWAARSEKEETILSSVPLLMWLQICKKI